MRLKLLAAALAAILGLAVPALAGAQGDAARASIQDWLDEAIKLMPEDSFVRHGIKSADVPQAKRCVVQAIVVGIPDEPAASIAAAIAQDPPVLNDDVQKWVFAGLEEHGDRRREVLSQVAKICPEFKAAMSS